jgi:hypothetical protein
VRYRLATEPMFIQCCHCLLCQRQTGSAFAINGLMETSRIELLGEAPVAISMPTESGRAHDIYRCPHCQVAVWSDYGRRPALRFVRIATLDRPHALVPALHIFVRSKVPWVVLPPGTRAFDEYYELAKEWPAESQARRRAILGEG